MQAFTGVRVLELSHGIAAGFAGRLLAGFGARVDSIEPPGGSPLRRLPPFVDVPPTDESSAVFIYLSANKRHVTLDLRQETGKRLFLRLVGEADAVLDDGALATAGIRPEELLQANERAVVVSISPFGIPGRYAGYEATEIVMQAIGGALYCSGEGELPPLHMPADMVQYMGGVYAAVGAVSGLRARTTMGKGQVVELSLARSLIEWPFAAMTSYEYTGVDGRRGIAQKWQGVQKTKDGHIGVNVLTEQQWQDLVSFTGMFDLLADERFATPLKRIANHEVLAAALAPWWAEQDSADIFARGMERRIPFGIPLTFEQIANWPHYNERQFVVGQCLPDGREIKTIGRPFSLAKGGWEDRGLRTELGGDNAETFRALGVGDEEFTQLFAAGAI